jgi:thioredoxin reductase
MKVKIMSTESLPVAVIGAGPVGLAAAAHLLQRGLPVKVYEAGGTVGAHAQCWGHVRLFSPWAYNVDQASRALLLRHGWHEPPGEVYPTGADLVDAYLAPLAGTPELAPVIETGARVCAIGRNGIDKVNSRNREARPFTLMVQTRAGATRRDLARAVIDASGTWTTPNPLGSGGLPADGEAEHSARIAYGIPDVLGRDRDQYAGRATIVVGAGHSAANVLIDLARLAEREPTTSAVWVVRGTDLRRVYGGGSADQLAARGELGGRLRALAEGGRVTLVPGFGITTIRSDGGRLVVEGDTGEGPRVLGPVDRIVAATGQRPDVSLTRELRLDLDPWLESAKALGPLIDPNLHSCGSVPPHGHRALSHPEPGFYTVGIKSYGRAPTFLMATGYEQVRSVSAALAGDLIAADDVQVVLPETGICSTHRTDIAAAGCCGGPAPAGVDACCVQDAEAKAATGDGCGCGSAAKVPETKP